MKKLFLISTAFLLMSFLNSDDPQTAQTRDFLCDGTQKTWYFIKMDINGVEVSSEYCVLNSYMVFTPTTVTNYSICDLNDFETLNYNLDNRTIQVGDLTAEITDISETVMWLRFQSIKDETTPIDSNYNDSGREADINMLFQTSDL